MASSRARGVAIALSIALGITHAHAQPRDPRAEAQQLFDRGLALLDAGDRDRALDHFLRSRALVPGKGNTANAAHCLHELGRYDEALELYEDLVARFADELHADNKQRLVPAMRALLARVGSVVITANVEGTVHVDGRPRGKTPLSGPVRVLGGQHVVRVVKDGYGTFERTVRIAVGETLHLDAVLDPLAQAGQLRLEDPNDAGADVFVDRVRVGTIPWEGTLGPGDHLVWTASGERGTAPTRAIVIQGQLATLRLRSAPLGPITHITIEPSTAEIRLDGVAIGAGSWVGRLPVGDHEIIAIEPGYITRTQTISVPASGPSTRVIVKLDIDASHPRWPRPSLGTIRVDALAGIPLGRSLGSDAEASCVAPCSHHVTGALVGARVGFRFPFGLSLEATGGYATFGTSFTRTSKTAFTSDGVRVPLTYEIDDDLRLRGAFLAGGAAFRVPFHPRFAVVPRVMVGAMIARVDDPVTGRAKTSRGSAPIRLEEPSPTLQTTPVLVEPSIDLEARFGAFHLGAGLGVAFVVGASPTIERGNFQVGPEGCHGDPASPTCAGESDIIASERAFRPFSVLIPTLSAGYDF